MKKTAEEILIQYTEADKFLFENKVYIDFVKALNAMEEYANQDRWISVSDSIPENEEEVIITNGDVVEKAEFFMGDFTVFYEDKSAIITDVTQWQKMPNPPKI